jgi:hypothetical protein
VRIPRLLFLSTLAVFVAGSRATQPQALPDSPQPQSNTFLGPADDPPNYVRPDEQTRFRVYTFDLLGPYPIFVSAATAGLHQAQDSPSAWGQGFEAYMHRFGSSFGIGAVETTTRYALARSIGEDTLYYECACKGFGPRLRHAVISSFTGRRGADGHRAISIPSIVAPYAGTFTAAYAWYPKGYGFGDAIRMGSYGLMGYVAGNISLEFLYGGPHSLLAKAHIPIPTNAAPQSQPPANPPDHQP